MPSLPSTQVVESLFAVDLAHPGATAVSGTWVARGGAAG